MRRLGAVALLVAVYALPICAQRSFSRGGFSGHAAGSRGGFSSSRSYSFAGAGRYTGSRYFRSSPMYRGRSLRGVAIRPGYDWNRLYRPRRPRAPRYGMGAYYAYPGVVGWIGADYLDYPDTEGTNNSATPYDYSGEGNNGELQPWPAIYENKQPAPESPPPVATPQNEDAVTLVFKDGRPSQQIYNYAMTATALYVLDSPHRNIPIDQLNLAATKKINDAAGVGFQVLHPSK